MERENASTTFGIGSDLPVFNLKNVNNEQIGSDYLSEAKLALVVFSCNHCPYVIGSEELLIEVVKKYDSQELRAVAINVNDADMYPDDSFEKMQEKAKNLDLPYPYLHDESQEIARQFDAACTPECYLFNQDHKLIFHGPICERPKDKGSDRENFLDVAIQQALAGEKIDPEFVHPIGCSIKWKNLAYCSPSTCLRGL